MNGFTIEEINNVQQPNTAETLLKDPTVLIQSFDYRFTPWSQADEFILVRRFIYNSIRIESNSDTNSLWKREFITETNDDLTFAHERVCDWKIRCSNIPNRSSQLILQHLISIESMINILLEEFKLETMKQKSIPERSNSSLLYNLYSIGVINFCNVLSSYSQENNFLSIRNLAKILQCPAWIVECRHQLSHPSSNPPAMQTLFNAITFGLRWMDEFFWNKFIVFELRRTIEPLPFDDIPLRQHMQDNERAQIHHFACVLMFSPNSVRRRSQMMKQLQRYVLHNSNIFIGIVVRILIFDVQKHCPAIQALKDHDNFPAELLRGSSMLFKIIFSVVPEHSLFLLLNLLTDFVGDLQQKQMKNSINKDDCSVRIGYRWLWKILNSLTKPMQEKQTSFERSFKVFSSMESLKNENQFTWIRLYYKILKLFPNRWLILISEKIYHSFIVEDLMPMKHYLHIENLLQIFVNNHKFPQIYNGNHQQSIKTVRDLIDYQPTTSDKFEWEKIFIGANLIETEEPEPKTLDKSIIVDPETSQLQIASKTSVLPPQPKLTTEIEVILD